MPVGFRTRNSGGGIQIDQTYRNLALRSKGSFSPGTPFNSNAWRLGSITVSGNNPVLAWRCSQPCALISATRSGTSITYQFVVAATTGTVEWWLFDDPTFGVPVGNVGLRIRNPATGGVVFDSRMKYMRVVGSVAGDYSQLVPPANGNYSGSPAIITGNAAYRYIVQTIGAPTGPPPYPWIEIAMWPMAAVNGSQVTWSQQATGGVNHQANETISTPSTQQNSYSYLFVDVSNY